MKHTDPRTEQIESLYPLARNLARKYHNPRRAYDHDDMVSIAMIACVAVVDTFDPSRGTKLSTHAYTVITRSLIATINEGGEISKQCKTCSLDAMPDRCEEISALDIVLLTAPRSTCIPLQTPADALDEMIRAAARKEGRAH